MVKGISKLDDNRVASVVDVVRGVANNVLAKRADAETAQTKAKVKREDAYSVQSDALRTLADNAIAGEWSEAEVLKARSVITSQHNGDKTTLKTLQNFLSYASAAMAPTVRPHVNGLWTLCYDAWREEEETRAIDKDAPTPIKLAFKRLDNMFTAALSLCKGNKERQATLLQTATDVDMWAAANDPALDIEKVKARLDAARDALTAFAHDYPMAQLSNVMAELSAISPKDVEAAWDSVKGGQYFSFGTTTFSADSNDNSYAEAVAAQDAAEQEEDAAQITETPVSESITDERINDAVDALSSME